MCADIAHNLSAGVDMGMELLLQLFEQLGQLPDVTYCGSHYYLVERLLKKKSIS